jgi:hypothetical protein
MALIGFIYPNLFTCLLDLFTASKIVDSFRVWEFQIKCFFGDGAPFFCECCEVPKFCHCASILFELFRQTTRSLKSVILLSVVGQQLISFGFFFFNFKKKKKKKR